MDFDISRDYLDGVTIHHPQRNAEGGQEIKANGGLHFLPSSPDGTMHTAVVSFGLKLEGSEQPFAQAGWRFLFTSSERYDPKEAGQNSFHQSLLVNGASKLITVLNNTCLLMNLPLIPFDAQRLVQQGQQTAPKA